MSRFCLYLRRMGKATALPDGNAKTVDCIILQLTNLGVVHSIEAARYMTHVLSWRGRLSWWHSIDILFFNEGLVLRVN